MDDMVQDHAGYRICHNFKHLYTLSRVTWLLHQVLEILNEIRKYAYILGKRSLRCNRHKNNKILYQNFCKEFQSNFYNDSKPTYG